MYKFYTNSSASFQLAWYYFNKIAISNGVFHEHLMEYAGNVFNGIWFCHLLAQHTLYDVYCVQHRVYGIHARFDSPFSCHTNKEECTLREWGGGGRSMCMKANSKMRMYIILWNLVSKMLSSKSQDYIYSFNFLLNLPLFLFRLMNMNECWKKCHKRTKDIFPFTNFASTFLFHFFLIRAYIKSYSIVNWTSTLVVFEFFHVNIISVNQILYALNIIKRTS